MKKWNALIVEDEMNSKDALLKMLDYLDLPLQIIGHTVSKKETLPFLKANKVDIVFLDVQLEDGTCFEILESIPNKNFEIIFTTAYNHHAIKAIKFNALDYLLKPMNPPELRRAVQKAIQKLEQNAHFQDLIKLSEEKEEQQIVLKTIDNRYVVMVNELIRLEGEGAYTKFVLTDKSILISKNLKHYETLLEEFDFVRVHQSHLVNQHKIKTLTNNHLMLSNGDTIPVSVRKKRIVKQILNM